MKTKMRLNLTTYCEEQGITFAELARRARVPRSVIADLAAGRTDPGGKSIAGLLRATGLGFRTIFTTEEDK